MTRGKATPANLPPRAAPKPSVCLVVLASFLAAGCSPDAPPAADVGSVPLAGRWNPARDEAPGADQQARRAELEALGYVAGSRAPRAAGGAQVLDATLLEPGLNLVVSAHAPEAVLMTSDGQLLHHWNIACRTAFPDVPPGDQPRFQYFRHAMLLPDGRLLAIFEGTGLVCLGPDSSLLWAWPGRAHHDLDARPDGRIVTLARDVHVVPHIDPARPIVEDWVVELSPEGRELRRVSLLSALEATEGIDAADARVHAVLDYTHGDVLHANTARLVGAECGEGSPLGRPGDVMISLRSLDLVGVLDFEGGRLRWLRTGSWRAQHQPQLLPDGHVLLFDNAGLVGRSRALEFDVATGAETWQWSGTEADPLWSDTCGSVQRLSNGNTLIVESDGGRALSVAPDGHVVWSFDSPWRAGEHGELVATLFGVQRLPADFPVAWMH